MGGISVVHRGPDGDLVGGLNWQLRHYNTEVLESQAILEGLQLNDYSPRVDGAGN